jgi:hypothetical protein
MDHIVLEEVRMLKSKVLMVERSVFVGMQAQGGLEEMGGLEGDGAIAMNDEGLVHGECPEQMGLLRHVHAAYCLF